MKYTRAILVFSILLIMPLCKGADPDNRRTNFLQILTDDQGWGDLGSYGHVFMLTPHIDQLAEEGMKFTHCYSAAAVCSPSRSAILTGRTPYRNGVFRWIPADHYSYLQGDEITLPQLLRNSGYQTAHFGKWQRKAERGHSPSRTSDSEPIRTSRTWTTMATITGLPREMWHVRVTKTL